MADPLEELLFELLEPLALEELLPEELLVPEEELEELELDAPPLFDVMYSPMIGTIEPDLKRCGFRDRSFVQSNLVWAVSDLMCVLKHFPGVRRYSHIDPIMNAPRRLKNKTCKLFKS